MTTPSLLTKLLQPLHATSSSAAETLGERDVELLSASIPNERSSLLTSSDTVGQKKTRLLGERTPGLPTATTILPGDHVVEQSTSTTTSHSTATTHQDSRGKRTIASSTNVQSTTNTPAASSPSSPLPLLPRTSSNRSSSTRWVRSPGTATRATGGSRYMRAAAAAASLLGDADDKTPVWLTSLNIMNGVLGAGIIGLPAAIAQSGLPLGIVICFVVVVMSNWTLRLLANLGIAHGAPTYEDLSFRAFGVWGFYTVAAFQALYSFGATVSYLVIIADTLPVISRVALGDNAPAFLLNRQAVLAVTAVAAVLPLCLYRAYAQLAKYSIIKIVALMFLVSAVVAYSNTLSPDTDRADDPEWIYRSVHAGVFPAIGTIAFAFVCHHQTFLAYRSLRNATQRRFAIVIHFATVGSFVLSLLLGVAGYLTFLDSTNSDILDNYAAFPDIQSSPVMLTARALLVINMITTFPGDHMVARGVLENVLERRRRYTRWVALRSPVHDVRLLTTLKAMEDADRAASADRWHWSDGCTNALLEHIGLTLLLFSAALAIALSTSNLGSVLEITGSFTAVFLAFILPAAIRLRLGPSPDDVLPMCHRNNWPAWIVLFFGVFAFVVSFGFSVIKAATGEDFIINDVHRKI